MCATGFVSATIFNVQITPTFYEQYITVYYYKYNVGVEKWL